MFRKSSQQGFTLMESLVATALFTVVVSAIVTIYISTVRIQRRANAIRIASENARYISEFMSKEIRNGNFDYYGPRAGSCAAPGSLSPDYQIPIVNVDNERICFYLGDNNGAISASGKNLWIARGSLAQNQRLNGDNVTVESFRVYLTPSQNPYCNDPPGCSEVGSTIQPRVTFVASIKASPDPQNSITIPLQTTISIPAYDIVGQE